MVLRKRSPLALRHRLIDPVDALRHEIDRLFNLWVTDNDLEPVFPVEARCDFLPRIDVTENDQQLEISAELPGMDEKDVRVELAGDRLILSGEKKLEREEKGYCRLERQSGTFRREIPLPWDAVVDDVGATFNDGVLTVTVPKPKGLSKESRTIHIKT